VNVLRERSNLKECRYLPVWICLHFLFN